MFYVLIFSSVLGMHRADVEAFQTEEGAKTFVMDAASKAHDSAIEEDGRAEEQVHVAIFNDGRHASVVAEYDDEKDELYEWFVVKK